VKRQEAKRGDKEIIYKSGRSQRKLSQLTSLEDAAVECLDGEASFIP
jgi:hypothetical protein